MRSLKEFANNNAPEIIDESIVSGHILKKEINSIPIMEFDPNITWTLRLLIKTHYVENGLKNFRYKKNQPDAVLCINFPDNGDKSMFITDYNFYLEDLKVIYDSNDISKWIKDNFDKRGNGHAYIRIQFSSNYKYDERNRDAFTKLAEENLASTYTYDKYASEFLVNFTKYHDVINFLNSFRSSLV